MSRSGNSTKMTRPTVSTAAKGSDPRMTFIRETGGGETPLMTKRLSPTGGVSVPISQAMAITMPNQMELQPMCSRMGTSTVQMRPRAAKRMRRVMRSVARGATPQARPLEAATHPVASPFPYRIHQS